MHLARWTITVAAAVAVVGIAGRGAAAEPAARPERVAVAGPAATAEPDDALHAAPAAAPPASHRHAVFVEALGKSGLWGLGYDYQLGRRFAVGGVASFYVLNGERVTSISPYAAAYPLGTGHHRLFVQLGPQLVRLSTPSPVPEWNGAASTGVGAELSSGWEYRDHVLVRLFGMATASRRGVQPWLGASLGWTL
jgi:hypothetical protein